MASFFSRALVPLLNRLPSVFLERFSKNTYNEVEVLPREMPRQAGHSDWQTAKPAAGAPGFALVQQHTFLRDTDQVRRFLPDILGRALARIWIDRDFRERFSTDPIGTMEAYDVFLPEGIDVEFVADGTSRPKVVVYEHRTSGPRRRLLYLQLVMMAGQ